MLSPLRLEVLIAASQEALSSGQPKRLDARDLGDGINFCSAFYASSCTPTSDIADSKKRSNTTRNYQEGSESIESISLMFNKSGKSR